MSTPSLAGLWRPFAYEHGGTQRRQEDVLHMARLFVLPRPRDTEIECDAIWGILHEGHSQVALHTMALSLRNLITYGRQLTASPWIMAGGILRILSPQCTLFGKIDFMQYYCEPRDIMLGIYDMTNNTLRLCLSESHSVGSGDAPGEGRPAYFGSARGIEQHLTTYTLESAVSDDELKDWGFGSRDIMEQ